MGLCFCKDGVLYYCICSMYFKYPNESKEEESASSSENKEKTTTKNEIADVEIVDADVEKGDEECLTPVYLGTSASLRTPHVQKDDPDEQLDL